MADIGEVVAVSLRGEMADREPLETVEERVAREPRHHAGGRRLDSVATARPEMGDVVNRIEDALRIILAREHRDGHRAADVGRVEAGMDRVVAGDHAADRNGTFRAAGRAGIGHHSAGRNGRHPHQGIHVPGHRRDVGALQVILGIDHHRERDAIGAHQRHDRLKGLQCSEDRVVVRAAALHRVGRVQRVLEPATGLEAPVDQGVAVDHGLAPVFRFGWLLPAIDEFNEGPPMGDPSWSMRFPQASSEPAW
jgi:hypothetical protein